MRSALAPLTEQEKAKILKLKAQGFLCYEIAKMLNAPYKQVYHLYNKEQLNRSCREYQHKMSGTPLHKVKKITITKEMPPTQPPGVITQIFCEKEIIETVLAAEWGDKLKPITATLAERRPNMNYNNQSKIPY